MNHGYRQSLCQLTVKELKQTDALLVRQIILSMRTCFFLSRTHTHHKDTHTHVHAGDCRWGEKQTYLLQEGKEWRRKVKKEKKKKNQELY